jgi:ferrous iron transport protein A
MTLHDAEIGNEYTVTAVQVEDEELSAFLFSLGLYVGERISLISRRKGGLILSIKDGRYSVDNALARAISVQ